MEPSAFAHRHDLPRQTAARSIAPPANLPLRLSTSLPLDIAAPQASSALRLAIFAAPLAFATLLIAALALL